MPKCSRSLRSWDHIRELLSRHNRVERLLISITVFNRCLQHKHCEPSPLIVFGPSSSSIPIILLDETWMWIHIDTSSVVRKNYCESLRTQLGKTCAEDETPDALLRVRIANPADVCTHRSDPVGGYSQTVVFAPKITLSI